METTTPLDSLKDAFWQVRSQVEYSTDLIAGNNLLEEDHHVYDILDGAIAAVTRALGEHVPGVTYDLYPRFAGDSWEASRRYDDGTPAIVTVGLGSGYIGDYRPRHDGDFAEWKARMAPKAAHLTAVAS